MPSSTSIPKVPRDPHSPTQPSHSRSSSLRSQNPNPHTPLNPSTLREAHTLSVSPGDRGSKMDDGYDAPLSDTEYSHRSPPAAGRIEPSTLSIVDQDKTSPTPEAGVKGSPKPSCSKDAKAWPGHLPERAADTVRETTSLLRRPFEIVMEHAHEGPCNHGTFSPNLASSGASIRSQDTTDSARDRGFFGSIAAGITNNETRRATARLAEEHGLKLSKSMWVSQSATGKNLC
jgi:hypothetical protein